MMKTLSPAGGGTALAALCSKDPLLVERSLGHLTGDRLRELDGRLLAELELLSRDGSTEDGDRYQMRDDQQVVDECHLAVASACVRRKTYRSLDKFASLPTGRDVVEDALRRHSLPRRLRDELVERHGHPSPPATWGECGKVVPDETDPRLSDADAGLREVPPSGDELELRSGWFRGPGGRWSSS